MDANTIINEEIITAPQAPVNKALLFAPVNNYSRAKRLAKALLGSDVRPFTDGNGKVTLKSETETFGVDDDFAMAFLDATKDVSEEDVLNLAAPELRAPNQRWPRGPPLPQSPFKSTPSLCH